MSPSVVAGQLEWNRWCASCGKQTHDPGRSGEMSFGMRSRKSACARRRQPRDHVSFFSAHDFWQNSLPLSYDFERPPSIAPPAESRISLDPWTALSGFRRLFNSYEAAASIPNFTRASITAVLMLCSAISMPTWKVVPLGWLYAQANWRQLHLENNGGDFVTGNA